jgi:hypothetical protein
MTGSIYAIIAALVFFCLLGIVRINEANAELAELKRVKLMDCKFNKGAHAHVWKNACMIKDGYVEVIS